MPEPSPFNMTTLPSFGGSSAPSGRSFMGIPLDQAGQGGMADRLRSKKSGSRTPAPVNTNVPAATSSFNRPQNADQRLALIQAMAQRARGRPVTGG
jgi:hypothetical protein